MYMNHVLTNTDWQAFQSRGICVLY